MTQGLDLLAEGGDVTLTDGTTISLRYSFRALALLEARYGSVAAVQKAIDTSGQGAAFGPIIQLVGAGCVGPGGFEPVYRRRTDGADIADLLHPGRTAAYVEAFNAAFSKALESLGNDGPPAVPGVTVETVSPGLSASTSPSVPSTFLPATSGT